MTNACLSYNPRWSLGFCLIAAVMVSGCGVEVSKSSTVRQAGPTTENSAAGVGHEVPEPTPGSAPASADPTNPTTTESAGETSSAESPAVAPTGDTPTAAPPSQRAGVMAINFDELNLQMQPDMVYREWMLTDRVKELDGRTVRIAGAMLADNQQKGVKEFVLLKNKECKFGPGGQADHVINVVLKGELEVSFTVNSVEVEGVLKVKPLNGASGNTDTVYELVASSFKKLRK
jgi:hypothetical protein